MAFSIRRLLAITIKELRHITRDVRIFFLVTLSPAFLLLVLANIFALDAGDANLAWLDYDRTPASRAYQAAITADGTFRITAIAENYQAVEGALRRGKVDMALIIPAGFEADLLRGARPAVVQAVADGTDAILTSQFLGNLSARTTAFGAALAETPVLLEARSRAWYNGELKSLWSMVPGLLAIVLTLPSLALTLAVTKEGEVGTLEALIASPVRGAEFLLGKLAAYMLSGVASAGLTVAVAVGWFGIPFRGSLLLFLLLAMDFYLACMGVSLLIAQFVRSQQTAMLMVLFIFFVPAFFVSGLIQPVNADSIASLAVSYALPSTHFIAIARAIFLKGTTLDGLTFHATMLALTGTAGTLASLSVFRKRIG
ncbi:MAG: ABC transporter permease [Anaerolineae bacterium]